MVEFIKISNKKEELNFFQRLVKAIIGIVILVIILVVGIFLAIIFSVFIIVILTVAPFVPKWWVSEND